MDLYIFEAPSFTGQCRRVQVPPKESFVIGSLIMVPTVHSHHIATFYTQENYSGCEISIGEWANNTSPRMGGIRSMHLYHPLILTSNEGLKRLFMPGDYPSVKMHGNVHSLSLPMSERDHGALMCEKGGACFSLFEEDINPLIMPFDEYDIPPHMELKLTMPEGTIAYYGKGTIDTYVKQMVLDVSFAYVPRTMNLPSLCYDGRCLSVGETKRMQLNVPVTSLTVPDGFIVTLGHFKNEYPPGEHTLSCFFGCTLSTIIVQQKM
jgi:hypothetical protein